MSIHFDIIGNVTGAGVKINDYAPPPLFLYCFVFTNPFHVDTSPPLYQWYIGGGVSIRKHDIDAAHVINNFLNGNG